jgi:hypothetical protein
MEKFEKIDETLETAFCLPLREATLIILVSSEIVITNNR